MKSKKVLALIMAVVMLVAAAPVSSLASSTMPTSVTSIEDACSDCDNLKDVRDKSSSSEKNKVKTGDGNNSLKNAKTSYRNKAMGLPAFARLLNYLAKKLWENKKGR